MAQVIDLRRAVGKRVRDRRLQLRWRPEKLADEVGISVATLSRLERGVRLPRVENLVAISRVLGLSLDDVTSIPD